MEEIEQTYRVVSLGDSTWTGKTAATPELAKLAAADFERGEVVGLERTDWGDHFGKPKVLRTVLIDAERRPGEWKLGASR